MLMMCHKEKYFEVRHSDSYFKPSYKELSNSFQEMHAEVINAF